MGIGRTRSIGHTNRVTKGIIIFLDHALVFRPMHEPLLPGWRLTASLATVSFRVNDSHHNRPLKRLQKPQCSRVMGAGIWNPGTGD